MKKEKQIKEKLSKIKSTGFFSITFSLTKKSKKALRYFRQKLKVAGLISSEKYLRM